MSISYNYFLPTNIYGTLSVTDLSFVGYTAVNANIYCQRNINCDGQLQCGQFHSLGASYFDQIPTCILNATLPTQLTNYQTVEALIAGGGGSSILGLNNIWTGTNTFNVAIISSGSGILANTIPATSIQNQSINNSQIAIGYFLMNNTAQSFGGVKTFTSAIISSGASITTNTINALSIVNNSISNTQIAAGFLLINTTSQSFSGIKTFISPIISSGASITTNTINALSIVDNSITNTQIATGFQLITNNTQTILGDKVFNGTNTANDMIINIRSIVPGNLYNNTISFIPACDLYYLNLSTRDFDSLMLIGQPIENGIDQEYALNICSYNSGLSGIRISGNGSPDNCNVVISGSQTIRDLLTLNNGLLINNGNIDIPQAIYAGTIACDFYINRLNNDIFFEAHNFTTYSVTSGNSSILPTAGIDFGGLSIGYNCSNSFGETDFISLANYSLSGGFNFYTMNAVALPFLIATLNTTGLSLNGSITNNKIINSSATLPYTIECGTIPYPVGIDGGTGLKIGWNASGGNGESNFINLAQGGVGGFKFSTINAFLTNRVLASINLKANDGLYLTSTCGQLKIDDFTGGSYSTVLNQNGVTSYHVSNGINASIGFLCGDATGLYVNPLSMNSNFVYTNVPLTPQSLTAFNISHPTTTLPLPTTTNQYATVGYVNTHVISQNLLPLNNIWTGTNTFNNNVTFNSSVFLAIGPNLNSNTNVSLVAPILEYYNYTAGAPYDIILPSPILFKGLKIIFRRYQTNISAVTLACPTGSIIPPNGLIGATTYIMSPIGNFTTIIISDGVYWQGL